MKTCSNIHCTHYDENAAHPCDECRRKIVQYQIDQLADHARMQRLKQYEKHKANKDHQRHDDD